MSKTAKSVIRRLKHQVDEYHALPDGVVRDLVAQLFKGRTWKQVAELLAEHHEMSPNAWRKIALGETHSISLEARNAVRAHYGMVALKASAKDNIPEDVRELVELSDRPDTAVLVGPETEKIKVVRDNENQSPFAPRRDITVVMKKEVKGTGKQTPKRKRPPRGHISLDRDLWEKLREEKGDQTWAEFLEQLRECSPA